MHGTTMKVISHVKHVLYFYSSTSAISVQCPIWLFYELIIIIIIVVVVVVVVNRSAQLVPTHTKSQSLIRKAVYGASAWQSSHSNFASVHTKQNRDQTR